MAAPGDVICAEALTYPGLKALAAQLRVTIVGLAMDAEGILPGAFEAACREHTVKALCCTPTLQNPTTATMSLARREALVAIARAHGVPIVEDDAYGLLPENAPPSVAALAPELTFHIAGLAKHVSPALRIAYLVAPDNRSGPRCAPRSGRPPPWPRRSPPPSPRAGSRAEPPTRSATPSAPRPAPASAWPRACCRREASTPIPTASICG
uniref:PLP-dependent aminotransferase family protein n=1 Tax=Phenylobacterium glaciei TaxID=2803784 RepID=A0A974P6K4_9CAUL|nr:PLP-dependent aminotransferase family protein [Phenylobacterium glaciei]